MKKNVDGFFIVKGLPQRTRRKTREIRM